MDCINYICYCGSLFPTINTLQSHRLYCQHFQNTADKNSSAEKISMASVSGSQLLESNLGNIPYAIIKVVKSWTAFLDDGEKPEETPEMTTNLWGRRLPRRTKVPYLSRAIPLSIDHSYQRCPCGAVFVTCLGKKQHQARFCRFVKNKKRKLDDGQKTAEGSPTFFILTKMDN